MAAKSKTKKAMGRYYRFGSYDTKAEVLHAASVLHKDKTSRAHVRKNPRTEKWNTMYAGVKKS